LGDNNRTPRVYDRESTISNWEWRADRNGKPEDIVFGYDKLEDYKRGESALLHA
jgi:hypothetical protein